MPKDEKPLAKEYVFWAVENPEGKLVGIGLTRGDAIADASFELNNPFEDLLKQGYTVNLVRTLIGKIIPE